MQKGVAASGGSALTLTGATLLSHHHHHHHGSNTHDPSTSTTVTVLTTGAAHTHHTHGGGGGGGDAHGAAVAAGTNNNHQHQHNHPHDHGSGKPCCGNAASVVLPVLTLKKPAPELVAEYTDEQLYATVQQVVRMGSLELLQELVQAWKAHRGGASTAAAAAAAASSSSSATTTTTTTTDAAKASAAVDAALHAYDATGHTLTHWAAKRVDDVRLVQYFLTEIAYNCNSNDQNVTPEATASASASISIVGANGGSNQAPLFYYPTPVHRPTRDDTAMTPLHWACTQNAALAVVKALLDAAAAIPAVVASSSRRNGGGGKNNNSNTSALELRDGTGCTPLLIAAQHGHVETVAYLIQRGADLAAVDAARDSATHWAAYKGSITVLGLLSFYDSNGGSSNNNNSGNNNGSHRLLQQQDAYGQTPLHLASLRGHVSVVRYILQQLLSVPQSNAGNSSSNNKQARAAAARAVKELLFLKDQNGRTPYDLAVHKQKAAVAAVLQAQAVSLQPNYQSWQAQLKRSLTVDALKKLLSPKTCKVWLGLPEVDDVDESPRFPFYYVVAHSVLHFFYYFTVFVPLYNTDAGVLWDYMALHAVNVVLMGITSYCLWQCHTTNPGRLDHAYAGIAVWRRLYEQTLDAFASADETVAANAAAVQLCHTCHIARPARSKHDRFSRACILQFDHHCPFVGTTVGLYNYKWFLAFLAGMTTYLASFLVVLAIYYSRVPSHGRITVLVLGLYMGLHVLFPGGMLMYHAQLVYVNLTTNEHLNTARYDYLWESNSSSAGSGTTGSRRFYNPWNKGCWANLLDRLQPGDHCYLLPEQERASELEMLLTGTTNAMSRDAAATTNQGQRRRMNLNMDTV